MIFFNKSLAIYRLFLLGLMCVIRNMVNFQLKLILTIML
jgi:hypothetical protein